MTHKPPAIIIDVGTYGLKYGLDRYRVPNVIPTIIARSRNPTKHLTSGKSYHVGKMAKNAMDSFISIPIEKRKVVDWDAMEKLWSYTFKEALHLREFSDRNIILAEPSLAASSHRGNTLQYMFEKYMFDGVCIVDASELAMRFANKSIGLVIDSGEEITQIVPIYDGRIDKEKVFGINLGGKDVTKYLHILLHKQLSGLKVVNMDTIRDLKEHMCKVSLDYDNEVKDRTKLSANFPMGPKPKDQIRFDVQRIQCTELLFNPTMSNTPGVARFGIPELVIKTVRNYIPKMQKHMYRNIVLAGGNTLFTGFQKRLNKEIFALQKTNNMLKIPPRIIMPEDEIVKHKYPTWNGAALLAKSEELGKYLITRAEFKERGIDHILKK